MNFLRRLFRAKTCEKCGNPESCRGKQRFIVLYDIRDTGSYRLNFERAKRCVEWTDRLNEIYKEDLPK